MHAYYPYVPNVVFLLLDHSFRVLSVACSDRLLNTVANLKKKCVYYVFVPFSFVIFVFLDYY